MNKNTSRSSILVISMGFLIVYLIFSWQCAIVVSLIVGVIGIISDSLSRIIELVWMKFAQLLNYIVLTVILSIVFFLFLFPISLIFKLFTKDPLRLSDKHKTYFVTINKEVVKGSFEKTW